MYFVGNELRDLDIKVGNTLAITGSTIDTSSFALCASYAGPSTDGAIETVPCDSSVKGSALVIEKTDSTFQLTLCEVQVYTRIGIIFISHKKSDIIFHIVKNVAFHDIPIEYIFTDVKPLYSPCYWNHDCEVTNSECTILEQGLTAYNFTCQCKFLYMDVDGECLAGTTTIFILYY